MAIQRRIQADMREIWFSQARFQRISNRAIWRLLERPRFRAAVDFLQLRAAAKELDSVEAQWWMDLADADAQKRSELIAERRPRRQGKRRRRRPARQRSSEAYFLPPVFYSLTDVPP